MQGRCGFVQAGPSRVSRDLPALLYLRFAGHESGTKRANNAAGRGHLVLSSPVSGISMASCDHGFLLGTSAGSRKTFKTVRKYLDFILVVLLGGEFCLVV